MKITIIISYLPHPNSDRTSLNVHFYPVSQFSKGKCYNKLNLEIKAHEYWANTRQGQEVTSTGEMLLSSDLVTPPARKTLLKD